MIPKIIVVALSLTIFTSAKAAESTSWTIENRVVPPPNGASETLRLSIAGTPQPDIEQGSQRAQSIDEWEELIESSGVTIPLEMIEQALDLSITKKLIAGVSVYEVVPIEIAPEYENSLFIYAHGGAYVFNGGDAAVSESALIAARMKMPALALDYRMPPDYPYPAAVDDFITVYTETIKNISPENIGVGGSSAGAGLVLAGIHKLKELEIQLPAAVYAGSPWADLSKTGDTMFTNEGIDRVLVTYDGYLGGAAELYASNNDLADPYLSPVYGDFSGFPPTILVSGTRDLFLSDTVRVHRKLRATGVVADLHVYEAMSHTGYGFMRQAPESEDFYSELVVFLKTHMD